MPPQIMSFCPRDSEPMVLHYAYCQILTYALIFIELPTFEYLSHASRSEEGGLFSSAFGLFFLLKILKSRRLYKNQSVCEYLTIGIMQKHSRVAQKKTFFRKVNPPRLICIPFGTKIEEKVQKKIVKFFWPPTPPSKIIQQVYSENSFFVKFSTSKWNHIAFWIIRAV